MSETWQDRAKVTIDCLYRAQSHIMRDPTIPKTRRYTTL